MDNDASEQQICPPTLADVKEAATLCDQVIKTPLLENPEVNSLLSGHLLIKAETAQRTGALTFPINQRFLTVNDDDVRGAMTFAFEHYKIALEPGEAVGLAAVLSQKIDIRGKAVAVVATGGNVDAVGFLRGS